jgi:hypothetical protein
VQPVQLSLIPEQIPPPPVALVEQLPAVQVAAAVGLLAGLIARAAEASAAGVGQEAGSDE